MNFFKLKFLRHIFLIFFILSIVMFGACHFIISPSLKSSVLESTEKEKIDETKNLFFLFDLLKNEKETSPSLTDNLQIISALNNGRFHDIFVFSEKGDIVFSRGKNLNRSNEKKRIFDRMLRGNISIEYIRHQSIQNHRHGLRGSFPDFIRISVPNLDRQFSQLGGILVTYDLSNEKDLYDQLYMKNVLILGVIVFAFFSGVIAILYKYSGGSEKPEKVEAALREAKNISEDANRQKSEFLSNMCHEIRTPISAAIGMVDLVLNTELKDKQRKYLEMAQTSIQTLLALFNDILDFSKIEVGNMKLEHADFDIRRVVKSVVKIHSRVTDQKKLDLTYFVAHDVPQTIYGDSRRIYQVIFNLVKNAVKFTDTGGITIRCAVLKDARTEKNVGNNGWQAKGNEKFERNIILHFSVKDTGIGIVKEKIETIFDSFIQGDGSSVRKYDGVGLGLSICKKMALLMGGDIWVESMPGKGSTFHFTIKAGLMPEEPLNKKVDDISVSSMASVKNTQEKIPETERQPAKHKKTVKPSSGVFDLALAIKENNENIEDAKTSSDYFLENVLNRLKTLEDVFHEENYTLLEKEAGEIKRMAMKAGAKRVANDAFRIELDIRKGELQDVSGKFVKMASEIKNYKEEINEVKWDEVRDV